MQPTERNPLHPRTLWILALVSLLAVATGGVLIQAPQTLLSGVFLIGVGSGIVIRTWVRNRRP